MRMVEDMSAGRAGRGKRGLGRDVYVGCGAAWLSAQLTQVIYAVSVKKKRPAISARCPPSAARLIEKCWAEDVNKRPTAAELVVLIDHIVRDLQGSPPT